MCVSSASTGLCGGRRVTGVPTAIRALALCATRLVSALVLRPERETRVGMSVDSAGTNVCATGFEHTDTSPYRRKAVLSHPGPTLASAVASPIRADRGLRSFTGSRRRFRLRMFSTSTNTENAMAK